MKRKNICVPISMCIGTLLLCMPVSAEKNYSLYINDVLIEKGDPVIVSDDGELLLPFRTMLESLGASVDWDAETGDTMVSYNQEEYRCFIGQPNPMFDNKYFYIKYMDLSKNTWLDNHVMLNPMSGGGSYKIINDRTYLYRQASEYFFEELGCTVEIDERSNAVKINQLYLYPFESDGLHGYKDSRGNIVVEPKYYRASEFSEGLAAVAKSPMGQSGFIDESGKEVIPCTYFTVDNFSDGVALVCVGEHLHDDRWTYIDKEGNRLFDKVFTLANPFSEGYAVVLKEGYGYPVPPEHDIPKKWSYINKSGEFVTELDFELAKSFNDGYAIVMKDGKWGVINNSFEVAIPCEYDTIRECPNEGTGKIFYAEKDGEQRYVSVLDGYHKASDVSFGVQVSQVSGTTFMSGNYIRVSVKNDDDDERYTYEWSCSAGRLDRIEYGDDTTWGEPDKDADYTETAVWKSNGEEKERNPICVTVKVTSSKGENVVQDIYFNLNPVAFGGSANSF